MDLQHLLHYVRVAEVHHFTQQRHLPDHDGRDPVLRCLSGDVDLLHREEALLPASLSGFVHFAVGALADLSEELVVTGLSVGVHCHQIGVAVYITCALQKSIYNDNVYVF